MKECCKCGEIKPLSSFYKHPQTLDGYFAKCKDCSKKATKENLDKKLQDSAFVEKEQARHREKYHRLGYKEIHKPTTESKREINQRYKERFPEMHKAKQVANKLPKVGKGMEKHHWSYNEEHYKDVIVISIADHNTIHRFLAYDQSHFMYRDKQGNLLDTKAKHQAYINFILAL